MFKCDQCELKYKTNKKLSDLYGHQALEQIWKGLKNKQQFKFSRKCFWNPWIKSTDKKIGTKR